MATSSTRFTNLNYWIDVKTGFDYLVQIQIPPLVMEKPEDRGDSCRFSRSIHWST